MPASDQIQFGLDTFGDVNGKPYPEVIRDVVEQGVLADRLDLDFFGVGEHHRDDYAISAPEIVLAAIAARTERIRLGTAVTVLSSDDPVRVYERFATLDAVARGRAEIILGRGSFTESFPLFGYDLADYERLFSEKLDLMSELLTEGPVSWEGTIRPALRDQHVYPKTESGAIRTWIGVGGSPESVIRAAEYGMPLVLAIIGGAPERFAPYVDLYHRALRELGQPSPDQPTPDQPTPDQPTSDQPTSNRPTPGQPTPGQPAPRQSTPRQPAPSIAVHCPGFVAATDQEAVDILWPHARRNLDRIGRERGWPPITRDRFEADVAEGAWHVGSPETVARKIAATITALGIDRFDLKYSHGPLPHEHLMNCIDLYATGVVPRVREILAESM